MLKTAYLMGSWTTMTALIVWFLGWEFCAVLKSRSLSKGEIYVGGESSDLPTLAPGLWFLQPEIVSLIIHWIWTLYRYTREDQIRPWKLFSSIVSASQRASLLFKSVLICSHMLCFYTCMRCAMMIKSGQIAYLSLKSSLLIAIHSRPTELYGLWNVIPSPPHLLLF